MEEEDEERSTAGDNGKMCVPPPLIPYGTTIASIADCIDGHPRYNSMKEYAHALLSDPALRFSQPSLHKVHSIAAIASLVPSDTFLIITGTTSIGAQIRTTVRCVTDLPSLRERRSHDGRSITCILFYMLVPNSTAVSTAEIEKNVRQERGPTNKIILAVQIASKHNLKCRVNRCIYNTTSPFHLEDCPESLRTNTTFERDVREAENDHRTLRWVFYKLGLYRTSEVSS